MNTLEGSSGLMSLRSALRRCVIGGLLALVCGLAMTARALAMTAYVTNRGTGTVTIINAASNGPVGDVAVGKRPTAIAITPNETSAYVATEFGKVIPIELATSHAGAQFSIGSRPIAIAIIPDGKSAYAVNFVSSGTVTL